MNLNYTTVPAIIYTLTRILQAISEYRTIENEISNYNRADTVNMSPDEMNRFRHITA